MPDHDHDDSAEVRQLRRIADTLEDISDWLECICHALQPQQAQDFALTQKGATMGTINGVQVGGSGVFGASLIPPNAAPLVSGPIFSTTDTNVTLTQSTTDLFNVTTAVAATETGTSFDLTVSGTTTAGPITHTFTIPVLSAPPPQAVDFDLTQLS